MDRDAIAGRIEALVRPLIEQAGLELYAVQYRPERGRMVVRLVVDLPEGGVTLDGLADLSRHVGHLLEVQDVVPGRYDLECTSPGVERPLLHPRHYARAIGDRVRLRIAPPGEKPRRLRGTLTAVDEGGVTVADDAGGAQRIAFEDITEARTEFDAAAALARRGRR